MHVVELKGAGTVWLGGDRQRVALQKEKLCRSFSRLCNTLPQHSRCKEAAEEAVVRTAANQQLGRLARSLFPHCVTSDANVHAVHTQL